jgi:signal transduction histidine kinase/ligand-binding sensor domain-containing protein
MGETHFSFSRLFAVVACQWLVIALLLPIDQASGQTPSLRHYDVEDGLAHSIVGTIYQDKKGYMWFGTAEGLNRFDGYRFKTYGVEDGLPSAHITSITEDPQGRLWIGTFAGIARMLDDPADQAAHQGGPGKKTFVSYRVGTSGSSNGVDSLLFDRNGTIWCASDDVYRAIPDRNGDLKFEVVIKRSSDPFDYRSLADREGRLWFGRQHELIEFIQGETIRYGAADGLPLEPSFSRASSTMVEERVIGIIQDSRGRIVAANRRNIFEFIPSDKSIEKRGRWRRLSLELQADREILSLAADAQGRLWIGTTRGLIRYSEEGSTPKITAQGLDEAQVSTTFEDRQGNLWIGTGDHGLYKSSGDFIINYTKADGLPDQSISYLIEDRQGRMYARMETGGVVDLTTGKFDVVPGSLLNPFKSSWRKMLYDSRGDYWQLTTDGLYHFKGPRLDFRAGKKITTADRDTQFGLGIYEDPAGRIWCGGYRSLFMLDRNDNERAVFKRIPLDSSIGIPSDKDPALLHCAISDRSGALWFGWHNDLGRYKDGKMVLFEPSEGLPAISPRTFFVDSRGWLWISIANAGVSVTRDPAAEHPKFTNYSVHNGLSGNTIGSIAEDDVGRIYLTGIGLDRLDPASGHIRHFNVADGLVGTYLRQVFKDHLGNMWIAASTGISKLDPRLERVTTAPPSVYFSHIQVAGDDLPVSETGAEHIGPIELPAARNNLLVEFVGLNFQGEGELRYQYKLEGVDKDWSAPNEQRSLTYARLGPGSYRLLVRAINAEGRVNDAPSIIEFRIIPPFWQRLWFILFATLLIASAVYRLYQYRVRRLLQLERVRTRIATDLHDEIGSNLSLIAMIGDLAKRQMPHEDSQVARWLSLIANTSRESVDSMSDIVWVVNPNKDRLIDLTVRMRRVADEMLTARDIAFNFDAPGETEDLKLGANTRREVFMIFKESINNLARHSQCTRAEIEFKLENNRLLLKVSDNGKGFDPASERAGNGLVSMRRRATDLDGELEIESGSSSGTTVTLRVPLKGKRTV